MPQWFRKNMFALLQLFASLIFLYYSFTETNRFYIVLTGRKGLFYLSEDILKLLRAAHLQSMTDQTQGFLSYFRQLAALVWQKGLQKIHQHFIHSTATFAQKAVKKYSENLVEICAPNWSAGLWWWEKGGWYGYMESTIRIFTRPTEMGYCFLDSNRIFNSFLNMETEKYFLQCKINLVSIGTTVCLGVPMFYRSVNFLIMEYRPTMRLTISAPLLGTGVVEEMVETPESLRYRRRRYPPRNSRK